MCSFFHGKEKIIECFYGFIDTDYIASDFISLRKDSPKKVIDQRKQYKHETSGEKRKEGGVAQGNRIKIELSSGYGCTRLFF